MGWYGIASPQLSTLVNIIRIPDRGLAVDHLPEGRTLRRDARGSLSCHRKATRASMVSLGRSSISQCPVPLSSITVTLVATRFICGPRIAALALSPAIDNTGIVNWF